MCKRASKKNDEISLESLSSFSSTSMMHPLHPHLLDEEEEVMLHQKKDRERDGQRNHEMGRFKSSLLSLSILDPFEAVHSEWITDFLSFSFLSLFSILSWSFFPASLHPSFHPSVREQERSDETRFKSLYNTLSCFNTMKGEWKGEKKRTFT